MGFKEFFGFESRSEAIVVNVNPPQDNEERAAGSAFLPPSRSVTGIGPKEAVRIGTVYRCVNIISTMISQMDVKVMRGKKEMSYVPAIIKNPIEGESFSSFVQQAVTSLALWGNCYIRLFGEDVARPSYVRVLDPDDVVAVEDNITGKVTYFVKGKQVPTNRIKHLKLDRMPGQLLGYGPLTGSAGVLKAAYLLDEFQRQWFDVTGMPKGVLNTDLVLNSEQSSDLTESWNDFIASHGGTIVLPKGITYTPTTIKPAEAQYLDVVSQNIRDVCRIFGIPAANMLSSIDGTSMTYTNQIESNIQFIQNTLSRYIIELEDFMTSLLPKGQSVNFDEESLLRLSPEKLWAIKKIQFDTLYYSGTEQREEEGKKPLPPVNFDTEGAGANDLAGTAQEEGGIKGEQDTTKDLTSEAKGNEDGFSAQSVNGKRTRCINDGQPLDGNETQFCSRKCKDEWHAKNKNKGTVV